MNKTIKPTDKKQILKFIHPDKGECTLTYQRNKLNNSVMFWFSYSNQMFSGLSELKQIVKHIYNNPKFKINS
jgi:hypothetical protein